MYGELYNNIHVLVSKCICTFIHLDIQAPICSIIHRHRHTLFASRNKSICSWHNFSLYNNIYSVIYAPYCNVFDEKEFYFMCLPSEVMLTTNKFILLCFLHSTSMVYDQVLQSSLTMLI